MKNKEQDFRDWLYQSANDFSNAMYSAERKMKEYALKYIFEVQCGQGSTDGFIAFNEESGFPQFRDHSDDMWRHIFGVRVKATLNKDNEYDYELYIYTDDNSAEDMDNNIDGTWSDGWFNKTFLYGDFHWCELIDIVHDWEQNVLND
jgi:hypothetical protein